MDRIERGEQGSGQAGEQRFVLRDAGPEELDEVTEVILRAYEEYTPSPLPQVWEEAWNAYWHDIGDVRGRLDQAELILAELAGRIVGTVTFSRRAGATSVGLYTMTWMGIAQGMYERMGFRRMPELDYRAVPVVTVMAYRLDLEHRRT